MTTHTLVGPAPNDHVALIGGDGTEVTYGDVRARVSDLRDELDGVVFLRAVLDLESVLVYIACIEAGAPVLLLDKDLEPDALERLVAIYRPQLIVGVDGEVDGYVAQRPDASGLTFLRSATEVPSPSAELALLLSTSRSTGSPKLVRLSAGAVISNADAIVEALGIVAQDRAITCLPYSYTYGLSIINSHLRAGATIVVSDAAVTTADFWQLVDRHGVTALAGVPTTYKMLKQMRWAVDAHPSIRYATQAGGRLADLERAHFRDMFRGAGNEFYVMYGQTEATARITITAPGDLETAISTAGRVIPGGRIDIREPDENGVGEVWYEGPNVMLGYAESAEDLAHGDDLGGRLATGDLGYLSDGQLFLTGRSKRIVKVFGKRVSLDDVDRWMSVRVDAVSVQGNDSIVVFVVGEPPAGLRAELAEYLHVHPRGVQIVGVEALPLLPSGKIDMKNLSDRAQS